MYSVSPDLTLIHLVTITTNSWRDTTLSALWQQHPDICTMKQFLKHWLTSNFSIFPSLVEYWLWTQMSSTSLSSFHSSLTINSRWTCFQASSAIWRNSFTSCSTQQNNTLLRWLFLHLHCFAIILLFLYLITYVTQYCQSSNNRSTVNCLSRYLLQILNKVFWYHFRSPSFIFAKSKMTHWNLQLSNLHVEWMHVDKEWTWIKYVRFTIRDNNLEHWNSQTIQGLILPH